MTQSVPVDPQKKKSDFSIRLVSAIFMAAFTVLVTWMGGQTFLLFAAVLSVFVLLEYRGIVSEKLMPMTGFFAFGFLFLGIASFAINGVVTSSIIFGVGFVCLIGLELFLKHKPYAAIGLAYAGLPFLALVDLRGSNDAMALFGSELNVAGMAVIFILYGCVWGADCFAYLVGRSVGGPKFAPRISPNKTWSGFIGSLIGGVLISWLAAYYFGYKPGFGFVIAIILLAFISQMGDLVESVLKRKFDKKDSGSIIPGHGGVLDRIDGLIFASVFMWLFGVVMFSTTEITSVETMSRGYHVMNAILPTN